MPCEIALRCRCGSVRGVLSEVAPARVNHLVCHCNDCQAFAHFLERADMLDAYGGTNVVQTAPSRVRITKGEDQLRCMRLSEKGLIRWYTACCRTPMGNTLSGRVPFVGLPRGCLDEGLAVLGRPLVDALGEPVRINAGSAIGEPPPGAHATASLRFGLRTLGLLAGWWVSSRGKPSPYFDPSTKQPRIAPTVLSVEAREGLKTRN